MYRYNAEEVDNDHEDDGDYTSARARGRKTRRATSKKSLAGKMCIEGGGGGGKSDFAAREHPAFAGEEPDATIPTTTGE